MKTTTRIFSAIALAAFSGCITSPRPSPETIVSAMGEQTESASSSLGAFSRAVDSGFAFSCEVSLVDGAFVAKGDDGHSAEGSPCVAAPLSDVLALVRPGKKIALVLKIDQAAVLLLKAALSANPAASPENVVLESADAGVCAAAKDILSDYEVFLLSSAVTVDTIVSSALTAKADGVDVAFNGDIVNEEFAAFVKNAGLKLRVNSISELPELLRAFGVGAEAASVRGAKKLYDEYSALYVPELSSRDEFSDRLIDGAAFPTGI